MYYGQRVGWIKIPLGMEVGLGPGHIVLNGDPTRPVSFTVEYKIDIVEFYLYMAFGADLLKNLVTKA